MCVCVCMCVSVRVCVCACVCVCLFMCMFMCLREREVYNPKEFGHARDEAMRSPRLCTCVAVRVRVLRQLPNIRSL